MFAPWKNINLKLFIKEFLISIDIKDFHHDKDDFFWNNSFPTD